MRLYEGTKSVEDGLQYNEDHQFSSMIKID